MAVIGKNIDEETGWKRDDVIEVIEGADKQPSYGFVKTIIRLKPTDTWPLIVGELLTLVS